MYVRQAEETRQDDRAHAVSPSLSFSKVREEITEKPISLSLILTTLVFLVLPPPFVLFFTSIHLEAPAQPALSRERLDRLQVPLVAMREHPASFFPPGALARCAFKDVFVLGS